MSLEDWWNNKPVMKIDAECYVCNGTGKLYFMPEDRSLSKDIECWLCNGTGKSRTQRQREEL